MRNNLVTIFHCAECGTALTIADAGAAIKPDVSTLCMNPKLDTGADIHVTRLSILPCYKCKDKYSRPARAIADAIKQLGALDGVDE